MGHKLDRTATLYTGREKSHSYTCFGLRETDADISKPSTEDCAADCMVVSFGIEDCK